VARRLSGQQRQQVAQEARAGRRRLALEPLLHPEDPASAVDRLGRRRSPACARREALCRYERARLRS